MVPTAIGRRPPASASEDAIHVSVTGSIESGQLTGVKDISCAYEFVVGPDWKLQSGLETGETQPARNQPREADKSSVVWNFPLELGMLTSNVSGWPRVSLCVRDAQRNIVGYSSFFVPTRPGKVVRYCRLFRPLSSSAIGDLVAEGTSELPEFFDQRFTTACVGREAVRAVSTGVVKVTLMTRIAAAQSLGYSACW